jgi:hypothetical protein
MTLVDVHMKRITTATTTCYELHTLLAYLSYHFGMYIINVMQQLSYVM